MTEVGIVGLPQAGKSSLMAALTGTAAAVAASPGDCRQGVLSVPDERVTKLSEIFQPRKTTPATIRFTDMVGAHGPLKKGELFTPAQLGHLRDMDLLVLVVRLFDSDAVPHPLTRIDPVDDFSLFLSECLLADLSVTEKRLERIDNDLKKGGAGKRKEDLEIEKAGLQQILQALESEQPVRAVELTEQQLQMYRGFCFLTGKQIIPIANTSDLTHPHEQERMAQLKAETQRWNEACPAWRLPEPLAVNAKLEAEIREMVGAENLHGPEALEYYQEVGLDGPSMEEIVQTAYYQLGLISFLTAGEDEVRAWTVCHNSPAPEAAGAIHSDIQKGFIRAEVVSYEDFIDAGTMAECRKRGTLRVEGKDYLIKDGDIVNFRFSV